MDSRLVTRCDLDQGQQAKGPHFLLLFSQRVFNLTAASLLENYQIPMLMSILIELGLNSWSRSEHDKSCFLKFKRWKRPFCFWMESILLGNIYHIINSDSITGHTVKNNHCWRDPKEPIGSEYQEKHINEV